jgi:hypothetical protein
VQYSADSTFSLEPINAFDALVALEQTGFWVEHQYENIRSFLNWLEALPKFRFSYSKFSDAIATVTRFVQPEECLLIPEPTARTN